MVPVSSAQAVLTSRSVTACFQSEADCNWAFQQLQGDETADVLGRPEKKNVGTLAVTVRMSCAEGGRMYGGGESEEGEGDAGTEENASFEKPRCLEGES
eukprot:COSAG06_NODE_328_length_17440_cov_46.327836_9_plen_99_part_00